MCSVFSQMLGTFNVYFFIRENATAGDTMPYHHVIVFYRRKTMDFLELSKKRFTAKKFDPSKKIPEDDIKKLKEILRLSPSSVNSQPWVFIFGSSDQAKKNPSGRQRL